MNYYKVNVRGGHCGAGKTRELIFYIMAKDFSDALDQARKMPSVKHHNYRYLNKLEMISYEEFCANKGRSAYHTFKERK